MEDEENVPRELENNDGARPSEPHNLVKDENNLKESQKMEAEKKVPLELHENEKKQQEVLEQEYVEKVENQSGVAKNCYQEISEKGLEDAFLWVENENELKEALGTDSNEKRKEDTHKGEEIENAQTYAHNMEESGAILKEDCDMKQNYERKGEETWKRLDEVHEQEIDENLLTDANDMEESEDSLKDKCAWKGDDKNITEANIYKGSVSIPSESDENEELKNKSFDVDCDICTHGSSNIITEAQEVWEHEMDKNVETSQEVDDSSGSSEGVNKSSCEFEVDYAEATQVTYKLKQEEFSETAAKDNEDEFEVKDVSKAICSDVNLENCGLSDTELAQKETEQNDEQSDLSSDSEAVADGSKENEEIMEEDKFVFGEKGENNPENAHGRRPLVESPDEMETSQVPRVVNEEKTMDVNEEIKENEYREKKEELKETGLKEVVGKEHLKKIDQVTEMEREREKDRLAVERAIREAREHAFAEACERAAVERATAEVRQRVMAEAREKLEKASAGTKSSAGPKSSSEKAAAEAKLRAEHAAVERATAEARERALRAMYQKSASGASRDGGMRQSSSSSDLHTSNGTNAESAQRSKAKLEKLNRIMERAAKALAEKEKRDLLAQKEQAERNRLAETLDADIKRRSSWKEGNLRALLSTLQYILGPDSGWQPVTLTEIINSMHYMLHQLVIQYKHSMQHNFLQASL